MTEPLYDIYMTGKLVEDTDPTLAQQHLAALFKQPTETVARFFDNKPHLLKRGASKNDALKYKVALHKIGILTAFKPSKNAESAAEKPSVTSADNSRAKSPATDTDSTAISLAPEGTEVLTESERQKPVVNNIDTSGISLASVFDVMEPEEKITPPAPDTSQISIAEVGADLLEDAPEWVELELDLNHISLAPPGTELEELKDDRPPLNPDISAISLAPPGSNLVDAEPKPVTQAPNTDHLALADDDEDSPRR